jgi:uncharacterized protein (DUF1697 family)
MTYIAFLRGINVGGKSLIKMAPLRACFERAGLRHVASYIASGNIIFESDERSVSALSRRIEAALAKTFEYRTAVVIQTQAQFEQVVTGVPRPWKKGSHLRRNVAFLRSPLAAIQALKQVEVKQGVDTVSAGKGVLYMSTLLSDLTKSGLPKLVGKPIYQKMTIRSYSTCLKILQMIRQR